MNPGPKSEEQCENLKIYSGVINCAKFKYTHFNPGKMPPYKVNLISMIRFLDYEEKLHQILYVWNTTVTNLGAHGQDGSSETW